MFDNLLCHILTSSNSHCSLLYPRKSSLYNSHQIQINGMYQHAKDIKLKSHYLIKRNQIRFLYNFSFSISWRYFEPAPTHCWIHQRTAISIFSFHFRNHFLSCTFWAYDVVFILNKTFSDHWNLTGCTKEAFVMPSQRFEGYEPSASKSTLTYFNSNK